LGKSPFSRKRKKKIKIFQRVRKLILDILAFGKDFVKGLLPIYEKFSQNLEKSFVASFFEAKKHKSFPSFFRYFFFLLDELLFAC